MRWPLVIPLIAPSEQLSRANALVQTGEAAATIGGPLLAGALVTLIRFQGVLIIRCLDLRNRAYNAGSGQDSAPAPSC
jgi:hypothetical protein